MPGPDFLDTNVLLYAYDISQPAKRQTAQNLVRRAVAGEMWISTQVLAEFAATLLHQLVPAASAADVGTLLDALGPIPLITADGDLVERSVEAQAAYGLHFYDAMIVAAGERAGCARTWSEDLNSRQAYFGIPVMNPFA